jgi:hypothetical protein
MKAGGRTWPRISIRQQHPNQVGDNSNSLITNLRDLASELQKFFCPNAFIHLHCPKSNNKVSSLKNPTPILFSIGLAIRV